MIDIIFMIMSLQLIMMRIIQLNLLSFLEGLKEPYILSYMENLHSKRMLMRYLNC